MAQSSSDLHLDDSQLARAKALMIDIRARLDVAAKLADADTNFQDEIQLDAPALENITDRVAEYFRIETSSESSTIAVASYVDEK